MLSTLLNSLASYFSKFFVIASWLPVAVFVFLNGLIGFLLFEPFHDWLSDLLFANPSATRSVFLVTAALIGTLAAAYVLSSLNDFLRGLLEGRWPEPLRAVSTAGQARRFERLQQRIFDAERVRLDVEADSERWVNQLREARVAGQTAPDKRNTFAPWATAARKVRAVRRRELQGVLIDSRDIEAAVSQLALALRANNADLRRWWWQRRLGDMQETLVLLILRAVRRAGDEQLRLNNLMASSFGSQDIAPTAMGNIANTAQAYAVRRYQCNLELFWSTLQRVVEKDAVAYASLLESKAQLDFLVACCWLTTVSWLVWLAVIGVWSHSGLLFVGLAIAGPLSTYFWYRVATESYRSFVDVLTTTLDLFRMDLLRSLGVTLPADVVDERALWGHLDRLASPDSERDDPLNLRYEKARVSS